MFVYHPEEFYLDGRIFVAPKLKFKEMFWLILIKLEISTFLPYFNIVPDRG